MKKHESREITLVPIKFVCHEYALGSGDNACSNDIARNY